MGTTSFSEKVVLNRWVLLTIGFRIVCIGQMKQMDESFRQETMVQKDYSLWLVRVQEPL